MRNDIVFYNSKIYERIDKRLNEIAATDDPSVAERMEYSALCDYLKALPKVSPQTAIYLKRLNLFLS